MVVCCLPRCSGRGERARPRRSDGTAVRSASGYSFCATWAISPPWLVLSAPPAMTRCFFFAELRPSPCVALRFRPPPMVLPLACSPDGTFCTLAALGALPCARVFWALDTCASFSALHTATPCEAGLCQGYTRATPWVHPRVCQQHNTCASSHAAQSISPRTILLWSEPQRR